MTAHDIGIGIDLGTSNSSICRLDVSRGTFDFAHARDEQGHENLPSLISVYRGQMYFGQAAVRRERSPDSDSLRNIKLLLRDNQEVILGGTSYTPVELIHLFLRYLKETYEQQWGPLTKAVITVPAFEEFDIDYQDRLRQAVMGPDGEPLFTDVITLKEPDAVLMSLIEWDSLDGQRILVFDMGGGTLDVSVREVTPNSKDPKRPILKALAITGSHQAGAALTFDFALELLRAWYEEHKLPFDADAAPRLISTNFEAFDSAKIALSGIAAREGIDAESEDLFSIAGGPDGRAISLSPRVVDLTNLSRNICEQAIVTLEKALSDAGLVAADIDNYIMVGGSSQLPLMGQLLKDFFGKDRLSYVSEVGRIDPYMAISKGAAVYDLDRPAGGGASATAEDSPSVPNTSPILEQILPYDLSLLVDSGMKLRVLIAKGTVLPSAQTSVTFYMPKHDDNIDIALYRGSGLPADASPVARRTVWFDRQLPINAEVHVLFEVSVDGAVTVFVRGTDGEPMLAIMNDKLLS